MADTPETKPAPEPAPAPAPATRPAAGEQLLQWLVSQQKQAAYTFLMAALVIAVLTILWAVYWQPEYAYVIVSAGVVLVFATLLPGLERLLNQPQAGTELDIARVVILTLGGLLGLGVFLAGVGLAWQWSDNLLSWIDTDSTKQDYRWRAGVVLFVTLAGLGIMFVSLQLGRTQERSNVVVRRMLYGFNAILTGLLLLAILTLVNVMVGVVEIGNFKLRTPFDFTASGQFSLSPRSENILNGLTKTVQIVNISGYPRGLEEKVAALLNSCRGVTSRIKVENLAVHLDQQRLSELAKKYPEFEQGSLLVIYDPDGKQEKYQFIKSQDIFSAGDPGTLPGANQFKFSGEDALMTAITFLGEDRKKPVIYFTQDHGELDINDMGSGPGGEGAGSLKSQLEKRNFDVKPLKFAPLDPKVPDDATLVVIAGNTQPVTPGAVKALRTYMSRNGKIIVMLNTVISGKKIQATGLEEFLLEYGVNTPAERLLSLTFVNFRLPSPLFVVGLMNRRITDNVITKSFEDPFGLENVRTMVIASRPGQSKYTQQPLMQSRSFSWSEADVNTPPSEIMATLQQDRPALEKKIEQIQERGPLPLLIGISEAGFDPTDPHAGMRGPPKAQKPRMLVYGTPSLINNRRIGEGNNFDLFATSVEWLREKPELGGIPPKVNTVFTLAQLDDAQRFRMITFPPLLILTCVLGLATGVWVVRRR